MGSKLPLDLEFYKILAGNGDWALTAFSGPWTEEAHKHFQGAARALCHRKTGAGAQGLAVLVRHSIFGSAPKASLHTFTPGLLASHLNLDALLSAGKFLFDSAAYGTGNLTIETAQGMKDIQAVDSTHFRTSITLPTSQSRPLNPEGPPLWLQVTAGKDSLQVLPLEEGIKAHLLIRDPALGNQAPILKTLARIWEKQPRKNRVPLLETLMTREELDLTVVEHDALDYSLCAALGAAGAWGLGMTEKEIFVHQGTQDYFIEIDPLQNTLWITAPVMYAYFGTFSWPGLDN